MCFFRLYIYAREKRGEGGVASSFVYCHFTKRRIFNESIWGLKRELYRIKYKNTVILSFIKDKIIIFATNFIYKRHEGDCKTKLS